MRTLERTVCRTLCISTTNFFLKESVKKNKKIMTDAASGHKRCEMKREGDQY